VTEPPIRVGVFGTGFAAGAHLEALERTAGVEVAAVAGNDPARTAALAARHGARAYDGYAGLLADPEVDAVHVCAVNRLHHELSLAALEQGKHVLSEKPLAVDSSQSAELAGAAELAAAVGLVSGVCFNYRHYPMVAEIRERLRSGEHGAPHFVHGAYLQDWLLLESDWNWRLDTVEAGASRAIADIGSHWADLIQHVTGDPVAEVFADLATLHPSRLRPEREAAAFGDGARGGRRVPVATEDFGTVLLRLRSGARGSFVVSQTSAGRKNGLRFQIDADDAAFAWEQEQPDRAWVGRRSAPNLELVRDPRLLHPRAAGLARLPAGHPEGWFDALCGLLADFYATVAARRRGEPADSAVASFADGHARVQLVEAVMASAAAGRWTALPAIGVGTS
jgi:predicted dehydrogenase